MRKWAIGRNNFWYTATIYLEEAPWYVFMIDRIMDKFCEYFPRIPLPKIKIIIDKEEYTLNSYFGTTADLFHLYIHIPIWGWCSKKTKTEYIDFPFEELQKMFPKDFENDNLFSPDQKKQKKIKNIQKKLERSL